MNRRKWNLIMFGLVLTGSVLGFRRGPITGFATLGILILIGFIGWMVTAYNADFKGKKNFPERKKRMHSALGGGWENKVLAGGLFISFVFLYITVEGKAMAFAPFAGITAGITLLIYGFAKLRQKRMIQNVPTSKVRSAAVGLLEVQGKVTSAEDALFTSPMLKKRCVYYYSKVQERRGSGKRRRWVDIFVDQQGDYIYLGDGTGTILVHLDGPELDLSNDYHRKTKYPKNEQVRAFCEKHGISIKSGFFGKQYRFTEIAIEPGDELYVLGTAKINPDGESTGSKLVIERGEEDTFLISEHGQEGLLKKYAFRSFSALFGGGALSVVSLIWIFLA